MRDTLAIALLRLCARLSFPVAQRLGRKLGSLLYYVPNSLRHVARINLRDCLPELSAAERHRLLQTSLQQTCCTLLEAPRLWTQPAADTLKLVTEVSGETQVREAMQSGRGVIICAPHLGAWEMVGLYCAAHYPMTSLYRPPRLAGLDAWLRAGRERSGAQLVPTDASGIRRLLGALQRHEMIGILPDQEPGRSDGAVLAPFFGIPAKTMTLLPRLASRSRAAVIFAYAERLPQARGFHLHFAAAPAGIDADDPITAATALNAGVEACVRQLPEQYQWTYKRFKTRSPGVAQRYKVRS
jgi:KDO2-lipid IV(A) lauroyltransferase